MLLKILGEKLAIYSRMINIGREGQEKFATLKIGTSAL